MTDQTNPKVYRVSLLCDGYVELESDLLTLPEAENAFTDMVREENAARRQDPVDASYGAVVAIYDTFENRNVKERTWEPGDMPEDDGSFAERPEPYDYYR